MNLKRIPLVVALIAVLGLLMILRGQTTPASAQTTTNSSYEVILLLNHETSVQSVWQLLTKMEQVSQIQVTSPDQLRFTTQSTNLTQFQAMPGVAQVIKLASNNSNSSARSLQPSQFLPTPTPACLPGLPGCTLPPTPTCDPNMEKCGFPTPTPTPHVVPCLPTVPGCPVPPTATCDPTMEKCGVPTPTPTPTPTSTPCDPRVDGCGFPTPFPTATYSPDEVGGISGTVTDLVTGLPLEKILVCAKPAYWYPELPDDKVTPTPTPKQRHFMFQPTQNSDPMPITWGGCATTTAEGHYEITSLPAFDYMVTFNDSANIYMGQYYNPQNMPMGYTPITVVAKNVITDINVALSKGGHITGQVVDKKNQPIEGIQVVANRYNTNGNWLEWVTSATTTADGNYDLSNLAAGKYIVGFVDMVNGSYTTIYYDDVTDITQAETITVLAGQTTPNINAKLSYGGSIAGQVTNMTGEPLANINVELFQNSNGYWHTIKQVTTNEQGQYKVSGLGLGTYRLHFVEYAKGETKPDGSTVQWPTYLDKYYKEATSIETATDITVGTDQAVENINAVLEKGGMITGKIMNSAGQPIGSDSHDFIWASVVVYQKIGDQWQWRDYGTVNNQTGEYIIRSLPTGTYRVGVSGNLGSYYFQVYYPKANTLEQASDITVKLGETRANMDLVVQDPNGHITGKVTNSLGQAVANLYIEVYQWQNEGWKAVGKAMTQADGQYDVAHLDTGIYRLSVQDWTGQYMGTYYQQSDTLDKATDIKVTAGQTTSGIDIVMSMGGLVTGQVTNKSGQPLAKIQVCALPSYVIDPLPGVTPTPTPTPNIKPQQAMPTMTPTPTPSGSMPPYPGDIWGHCGYTQENGVYTVTNLTTGSYILQFYGQESYLGEYYNDTASWSEADPVAVTFGQVTSNINAVLSSGGTIAGLVTDAMTQKPLANISVCSNSAWGGRCVATDAQGQYLLTSLSPGLYVVSFQDNYGNYLAQYYNQKSRYEEAELVKVASDETVKNINAALTIGGRITGTVRNAAGQPLERIMVSTYISRSTTSDKPYGEYWGLTNERGEYEIKGLASGSYYVRFYGSSPKYSDEFYNNATTIEQATPVIINAPETTPNIDAVLETAAEIKGQVTFGNNQALNGVMVEAYRQMNQTWQIFATSYSDYEGNYSLMGLAPGTYRLHFVASYYGPMMRQKPGMFYADEYYDNAATLAEAKDIEVMSGQTVSGINASLSNGGHITGQITDKSGTPIMGIGIEVYRQSGEGPGVAGTAYSDEQGNYDVAGLNTGSFLIRFWDGQRRYAYEFYNDVAELTQATPVSVKVGETTANINAQLSDAMSPVADIKGDNSQVVYDTRGLATINQTSTQPSDVTVEMPANMCTGTASNVTLHMNTLTYAMQATSNGLYQATIPASQLIHGATLTVSANCNGNAVQQRVGQFLFTDRTTPTPGETSIKKVYLPLVVR